MTQMNKTELEKLGESYFEMLEQQKFNEAELDYSVLEMHKPILQKLAETGNSVITVFDIFQKKHVYYSANFGQLFGYTPKEIEEGGETFMDTKIHPEDYISLLKNGIMLFKFLMKLPVDTKLYCKLINEYRILNASNQYVRVVEQFQSLELDSQGNVWLSLSILDISPNQNVNESLKAQIINFKTGQFIPMLQSESNPEIGLTGRELEILKLVKEGLLSKEISDKLYISVHTVNTHRQRVLEKLNANNSMEAVVLASRLGLI